MKCYSRGALRFFVVLILIETRAVLITRFPLALIFSCAGFPTFAYLGFFFSWYSRAKCQTLGGGVESAGGGCTARLSLFVIFSRMFSRPRAGLATV